MTRARSGVHLGRTAPLIVTVICLVAAALVVVAGAADAVRGPTPSRQALATDPSILEAEAGLNVCAEDDSDDGAGDCEEFTDPITGSHYSRSAGVSDGGVQSSASVGVTIDSAPGGLFIEATGGGHTSSSIGENHTENNARVEFAIAVGSKPVAVDVRGELKISGTPCTSRGAHAYVEFGDGSSTGSECPDGGSGQTLSAHYVADAGTTVTISANAGAALHNEINSATASFEIEIFIGCTQLGSDGPDELIGTAGDDILCGLGGPDLIRGLGGNDVLLGNDGSDELFGGGDDDYLQGGNDANDLLFGGTGDDFLFGGAFLFGGSGDDVMAAEGGDDILFGCAGRDLIAGGDGEDTLYGANPAKSDAKTLDLLLVVGATPGEVACSTSKDRDVRDIMNGGAKDDIMHGGPGPDRMHGDAGVDKMFGDGGDDQLEGGNQGDKLRGGSGRDKLLGQGGGDNIAGNKAFDIISGGGGNDTLLANDGVRDDVRGGAGKDKAKRDPVDKVQGVEAFI